MSRTLARLRARQGALVDLTESNPTRVGLDYPPGILNALADESGLVYDPQPRGLAAARGAVARHLDRQGVRVDPSRVALAAGTSEAYSRLFTLLCDPGDEVLVPRPGYPLLDHLARLDGLTPRPYSLVYRGDWEIDGDALERQVTPRTRALVVVNPNNLNRPGQPRETTPDQHADVTWLPDPQFWVRSDSFEAGLKFLSPVALPVAEAPSSVL